MLEARLRPRRDRAAVQATTLFAYAFISNLALAVLPHEPAVIWYGARLGVWPTTLIATAGTVAVAGVTVIRSFTLTVALAVLLVSAWAIALTVTSAGLGTVAGAM